MDIKKAKRFLIYSVAGILFAILLVFPLKRANAVIVDQVIAIVDNTPVTLYDFAKFNPNSFRSYEAVQEQASQGIFTSGDAQAISETRVVITALINKILLEREEEKAGIYIPDKSLNLYVKDIALSNNLTVDGFFALLKSKGISKSQYIAHLREHFMKLNLLRKVYGNKMIVTDKEMRNYYRANIEEFRGMPMVDLKLIFLSVPPGASKTQWDNTYKLMEKIRGLALSGNESFSSLAKKYSEDPSEKNGGRLGYVYKDKLSPSFSDYAFSLSVGDVSKIIKSQFGYSLIKTVGKKMGKFETYKMVKQQIFSVLEGNRVKRYTDRLLKKLRKNSYVKILIPV